MSIIIAADTVGNEYKEDIESLDISDGYDAGVDIAQRIRAARKQAGLTQVQLAERLQVQQSAVSQWENGKIDPELDNRIRLSEILKIPLPDLLPEASKQPDGSLLSDPRVALLIDSYVQLPPSVQTAVQLHVLSLLEAIRKGR